MFRRMLAAAVCAVCISAMLCGCESKGDNSEDIPDQEYYGLAIKEVSGKDIYLIYDGNYVSDEEMDMVSKYYVSIQNKDQELFKSTQPEEYLNFLKEKQSTDIEAYINEEYTEIANEIGEGFSFTQIDVTDCGDGSKDLEIGEVKNMLDDVYDDAGKEKSFSDTVKDEKYITYTVTAENKQGEVFNLTNQRKYIFTCDDGIYVF